MTIISQKQDFDIVVVGGGPAGAAAAIKAAEIGLRVCLVEKRKRPGQKLCGGAIPKTVLSRYAVTKELLEYEIKGFSTYDASKEDWSHSPMEWGATIQREIFDRYLVDRAKKAGARVFLGTRCMEIVRNGSSVHYVKVMDSTGQSKIYTPLVILADSFYSQCKRYLYGTISLNPTEIFVASQCEIEIPGRSPLPILHFVFDRRIIPVGYGWIFPKRWGYTVGVGILFSHSIGAQTVNTLRFLLDKYEPLRSLLSGYCVISPIRTGFIPARQQPVLSDHGVMLAGDAAGQVSPLWGEGISHAVSAGEFAAEIASEAISKNNVSRSILCAYDDVWRASRGNILSKERQDLDRLLLASSSICRRVKPPLSFIRSFGAFAEIAYQFRNLRFPILNSRELVDQCGGIGRTFLFRGKVLQLKPGLLALPEQMFPIKSWEDVAVKIGPYLR